jgi:hypothetical protein
MNVLIFSHPTLEGESVSVFSKQLIDHLLERGAKIALWLPKGTRFDWALSARIALLGPETEEVSGSWDIVLIEGSSVYKQALRLLGQLSGVPHIFISHSLEQDGAIVPYPSLFRVIDSSRSPGHDHTGIAPELIEIIPSPVSAVFQPPQKKNQSTPRILYLHNPLDRSLSVLACLVATINRMPGCKLLIVATGLDFIVKQISNDNIKCIDGIEDRLTSILEADLVVASGNVAAEVLMVGRPLIVAGIRGFGGLVTPDTYSKHAESGFQGRIGGVNGEIIPVDILEHAIKNAIAMGHKDLIELVRQNRELAEKSFQASSLVRRAEQVIEDAIMLNRRLNSPQELAALKPRRATNVIIKDLRDGEGYLLIRRPIGTLICRLSRKACEVFNDIDGTLTLMELYRKHVDDGESEFTTFAESIKTLWHSKAVVF